MPRRAREGEVRWDDFCFARLLDLPPYGQIADQDEVSCCEGVRPDGRIYSEADARQDILRRTR